MATLLDSGILLRFFVSTDAEAQPIRHAFRTLRRSREPVYVASQNVAEFWNVSTRPATARGG
jgi:predicted nucleic acid-binding protein